MAESDSSTLNGIEQGPFEPIAIVGLSCILPDSPDIETFWQNIIDANVSIKELPDDRWNIRDFFDAEGKPGSVKDNKTYSKIGAFVEDFEFNWRRWRQPPGTLPQIDISQLWAVEASAAAIEHAGYGDGGKELDRAATGVIFANALGGENRGFTTLRIHSDQAVRIASEHGMTDAEGFLREWNDGLPKVDEDTMPGELANVVAGRVANLLDLQGPNYTTDAACASSMAALVDACRQLQARQVKIAVCGASDRTMEPATYSKFSAIGALSPTHSTPFDARANGFVMGEGAGVMILKRLGDAIRDGDEIYSVVRGVGASSDGRGKGITAPSKRGQLQAVSRAYSQAGFPASSVELIEAHGTSTRVGDATELGSLSEIFDEVSNGENVAVGSIKSQIGHLKAAAGIAGMLKTVLALHHRTIPPSAGFSTPNESVDWTTNPFFVPTEARDWPETASGSPRRAGVSAFGFGGTNFHVALEKFDEEYHSQLAERWDNSRDAAMTSLGISEPRPKAPSFPAILDPLAKPSLTHEQLKSIEGGLLLLSGANIESITSELRSTTFTGANFDEDPKGLRLSQALADSSNDFDVDAKFRLALIATSWAEFEKRKQLALNSLDDEDKWGFLQAQGILVSSDSKLPDGAKIAHMYPGQGSQYVGMTLDLHLRYNAVQEVWKASDLTMDEVLDGDSLSDFVLQDVSADERKAAEMKLMQTEYTQPAMLTADLAIEQTLNDHGLKPDMVAGHSLGEYGALMSSGILDMDGALRAAAARGTEMGNVVIEDTGLMASVTAPYEKVREIIDAIDGYVIAANKNSPKMTVIAGDSAAVKLAMHSFESAGFQCTKLPTSHAFHSRIVAPANEPLRRYLEGLDIRWPKIPITANVDGLFYPLEGDDSKAAILEKLAPQMASPVEWTRQILTMYEAGARIFVEVGPKRALTVFASQILEDKPHLAVMTNHPKQGGIASLLLAMGMLALAGRPPKWPQPDSTVLTEGFRAGPIEAHRFQTTNQTNDLSQRARPLPSNAAVKEEHTPQIVVASAPVLDPEVATRLAVDDYLGQRLSAICGYPARFCGGQVDLRTGLGLSDSDVSSLVQQIAKEATTDPEVDGSAAMTAGDLSRWVSRAPSGWHTKTSAVKTGQSVTPTTVSSIDKRRTDPFVITGISLGLPGGEKVFDEDVFERLVRGETSISEVTDEYKQRLLDKNIVRLIKGRDGSVNMDQAREFGDIPQLAGVKSSFDLAEEFGLEPKVVQAWDITTQLACAAGLLALKDAAIPLTPVEQVGKGGLRLIRSWQVPSIYRDRTGIVFASCFPGIEQAFKHAKADGADDNGNFDRRFLFQVLNMGHSQFAQHVGIRGPNTTINLACASTTAAFGVAEDWLANDRCDRVIVISGDDVTGDSLWEWIGSGFAASGAAATGNVVEETALPFDKRRNGLILGMGAAAFVIEKNSEAEKRGVQPISELLGTRIANSAFHGTRLDVEHVADTFSGFIGEMEDNWSLDRHQIAPHSVFFSHETFTPARGGSAQAEVRALRQAFGESTNKIIIANTKGFTGHPMGVGIEDASMLYGILTGRIPPIANHREVDEELGDLKLSTGGDYPEIIYGLRFAAGFGSQIALSMVRKLPVVGERIDGAKLLAWNKSLAQTEELELRVMDNKLVAFIDADNNLHGGLGGEEYQVTSNVKSSPIAAPVAAVVESKPVETPATLPIAEIKTAVDPPSIEDASGDMVQSVIDVVVKHTGYPADFVELDQDLEGELGIDTVKQAEIMAEIRDIFSLPVDEDFILSDHPTLNHMISYIQKMTGGSTAAPVVKEVIATPEKVVQTTEKIEEKVEIKVTPVVADSEIQSKLIAVVVEHTGYPEDFIEMDQDLEGELGIDTVKQAEIMGDIREIFSLPVDEDFVLSDHPTLNHFIAYITKMTGGATNEPISKSVEVNETSDEITTITEKVETSQETMVTDSEIQSKLVAVVVEHTGYPDDFIEMDQDLEGELGIDTVKQAEIMGDIREIFSLPVDEDFILSDHPTLNHFVSYIVKMTGDGGKSDVVENTVVEVNDVEPTPVISKEDPIQSATRIDRRRWQVEVEECAGERLSIELKGTVAITDDGWGLADAIVPLLEAKGLKTVRIGFEPGAKSLTEQNESGSTVYRLDPASSNQLAKLCSQLTDISGLLHLAPLRLASEKWSNEIGSSNQITLAAHSYFGLLKGLDSQLSSGPGILASVTALDGRHGNHGERFNSLACAASGITKSYSFEQENVRCRAFDLHQELILDSDATAALLVDDLFTLGGEVEIGIDKNQRRWTLVCFAEDLIEKRKPLANADLWLVSGGGSGVTASSIIALSEASPNVGAIFLLLGRSTLVPETKDWLNYDDDRLQQEKMSLRERMTEASESGKITMVQWNKEWQNLTRSLDIRRTIQAIESAGNKAEYHSADVTDVNSIKSAIDNRSVTGIVHGAGLEDSKLVTDKSWEIFDRVVRVKVDGWRALISAAGDHVRFACAFTSVAGRFGNGGQTDYAAANSVLDAEMARLSARGGMRAVAIGWTGWRDVGMATRGSIEAIFEAAGIDTLSVEQGVEIFVDEVLAGGKRRVLGCGSLGLMDRYSSFRESPLLLPGEMAIAIADPRRFPFVDKILSLQPGKSLSSQTTLSVADHPFLADHAIEGVPYHPGVMALEMFSENSLLLCPNTCLAGFEDVKFGLPIKLLKGAMTIRTEVEVLSSSQEITRVSCRIVSDLVNSKGQIFGEPRIHHQGVVRLTERKDDLTSFLQSEIDTIPSIGVPADGEILHHPSFIYLRYFHGPRFQSHGGILRGVGDSNNPGVDGLALMRHQLPASDQFAIEFEDEEVLLDCLPMLIEAGFQNAGLVAMESEGASSLPIGIEWSTFLRVPDQGEKLRLRSVLQAKEEGGITVHDVIVVGDDHAPVIALKGLRLKAMAPVPEEQKFTLER